MSTGILFVAYLNHWSHTDRARWGEEDLLIPFYIRHVQSSKGAVLPTTRLLSEKR